MPRWNTSSYKNNKRIKDIGTTNNKYGFCNTTMYKCTSMLVDKGRASLMCVIFE